MTRLWKLFYEVAARAGAAYLTLGERGVTTYVRGTLGSDDHLPGLSDVDLALVVEDHPAIPGLARERATKRLRRLREALPVTELLFDLPRVYEISELRDLTGSSAFTYGLDGIEESSRPATEASRRDRAAFFGERANETSRGHLSRPGLYGAISDWRMLAGADRRPDEPVLDAQARRCAAWLELQHWWRWVFAACIDPSGPRTASLCVKLVAEPARIWLWLAHGERAADRVAALRRTMRLMPEEEAALQLAAELHGSLSGSPDPPLAEVLPALLRLSGRIAALIAAEIAVEEVTEVELSGHESELLLPGGGWRPADRFEGGCAPPLLPLVDWRALARPPPPDEAIAPLPGDPGDPALLGSVAASQGAGPYPALRADRLIVLPSGRYGRLDLRAIACQATDPVSFALIGGERSARFPNVSGWSAEHTARRAVAEHRGWLTAEPGSWAANGASTADRELGMLLTAARAALFLETLLEGEPRLALTVTQAARELAARSSRAPVVAEEALDAYRELALRGRRPAVTTVSALREHVLELPGFSGVAPAGPAPSARLEFARQ